MSIESVTTYPKKYETEVLLRDGSRIRLRPLKREDTKDWLAFINKLSPHSRYLSFHYFAKEMTEEDAARFCTIDYQNTFALVAKVLKAKRSEIVAVGRYYRLPNKQSAELALSIADAYQEKGIGTKLIERLANAARNHDIDTFEADVLAENKPMMQVFRNYGFHITSKLEAGVYHVSFPIARTRRVRRKEAKRARISTLASLRSILCPRSVAVIGASRKPGTIGQLIFQSLLQARFSGVIYPVNPNAKAIMSVKAYPSILDVPDEVDLAIIVVPAPLVAKVADECGHKGVPALIVISDGFRERGAEGAAREKELRAIALGHGMRLVGPNCMGVINTDPAVNLNATFSRIYPPRGNIALLSQSGAMGLVILEHAQNLNLGISTFVSAGNRADISSNDLLQYWEQDRATKVILLYLESFGNPRKFSRLARRVSAKKPIVAVKGGRSSAGSRAASSHTGALATPEIVSDALFHQAGIIRVNSVEELFNLATLLSNQPIPKGKRLVIVTNGGGPGIIAADASEQHGLVLPEFSPETKERLKTFIKRDIKLNNPLDLTAGAGADEFEGVLKILAKDQDSDCVLTIFIPPIVTDPKAMADAIRRANPAFRRQGKPLVACFMGQKGIPGKLGAAGKSVPSYLFPEDAVSALAKAVHYHEIVRQPKGTIPKIGGIKRERARKIMAKAMTQNTRRPLWLAPDDIFGLLDSYGIRSVPTLLAKTPAEAAAHASTMGFPVVIKLNSPTIVHKTDVGGVILDLESESEVKKAFNNIKARLTKLGREGEMDGVIVQKMIREGTEAIVGVTQDPSFGPLIMFGLGGIYAELLKDIAVRLHPLTDLDARSLIGSVKMAKLLEGFRDLPPADTPALEDLLLRFSALVEDIPEIAELDLNPVKVMPRGEGYWVVDARAMVK